MNHTLKNMLFLLALVLLVVVTLPVAAASLFAARTALVPVLAVTLLVGLAWPRVRHALTE